MNWIDINKRKPKDNERILVYSPNYNNNEMTYRIMYAKFLNLYAEITHWTKLEPPKEKKIIEKYPENSTVYSLVVLLRDLMLKNNPKAKIPNLQSWCSDIDKMIRLDNRMPAEIAKVIEWCQKDSFWFKNILSAKKLRQHYDRLILNMNQWSPDKQVVKKYIGE